MNNSYTNDGKTATGKFDPAVVKTHVRYLHHLAARANVPGKLVLAAFGENPDTRERFSDVRHFAIGDVDGMTAAAMAFDGVPHANLYSPMAIMRPDLPEGSKGTEQDVVSVLGLVVDGDADKGKAAPVPPLPADYVIESSVGNFQHFICLDGPLPPQEAKQFAEALKRATGADCANDLSHVWRIPGCLNWPNAAKLNRGRSREPQPVRIARNWDKWTSVAVLRDVLAPHWEEPRTNAPVQSPDSSRSLDQLLASLPSGIRDRLHDAPLEGERSEAIAAVVGLLIGSGCSDVEIDALLHAYPIGDKFKDQPARRRKEIERLRAKGFGKGKSAQQMFAGSVPSIASPPLATVAPCPVPLPGAAVAAPAAMPRNGLIIGPDGERLPIDSEDSLALDFVDVHVGELRHCEEWGKWLRWNDTRWQADRTSGAYNLVRKHLRKLGGGMHPQDARKILSGKTVAAVERMAKTDPRIATEAAVWDADPWLLNTPGGVVDLRTCVIREARRADHMTKSTAVAPGGECPTWRAFLQRALASDADLISFVQRMLGYSLTGDTREQALFFLYGQGGNGKGVLLNSVAGILADYAKTAPMATFTDSANAGDRHPTDLAGLRGARFVMASETEKGRKWAEAKIKSLTGGDPIAARFMGRDFFEYVPTFKLVIAGNHKPRLGTVDEAIRRRMNMVPFTVQIPEHERDKALPEKLRAEWPGILQWMIEGCLAWQQCGLRPPAAVRAATEEYLTGEDATATWLDERCEPAIGAWTPRTELFASWSTWANNAREPIGTANQFYETLASKGFEGGGRNGVRGFRGIRLRQFMLPPVPER